MSVIHDLLDRMPQGPEPGVKLETIRKRRREEDVNRSVAKRPRTRAAAVEELAEQTEKQKAHELLTSATTRRNLALIQIRYGVYNSPAPTYLLDGHRPDGTKAYEHHEYIVQTLTSKIAAGATDVAHNTTLEFLTEDTPGHPGRGQICLQRRSEKAHVPRIHHLRASGIRRCLRHPAYFRDFSWQEDTVVLESKRSGFLSAMKGIHTSGVRHRDIRLENLTRVDNEGNLFIIDFDMAELNSTVGSRGRELEHLTELLDGHYIPPDEFPSEQTPNPDDYEKDSIGSPYLEASSVDVPQWDYLNRPRL